MLPHVGLEQTDRPSVHSPSESAGRDPIVDLLGEVTTTPATNEEYQLGTQAPTKSLERLPQRAGRDKGRKGGQRACLHGTRCPLRGRPPCH